MAASAVNERVETSDVQGLVLQGYGKLRAAAYVVLEITDGKVALASLELRPTMSLTVLTTFHWESTALKITPKELPTVCPLGVPVLPDAVPGAAVSPGNSNCSLLNGPVPTTTLPEVVLVKPEAVKLSVIVSGRL